MLTWTELQREMWSCRTSSCNNVVYVPGLASIGLDSGFWQISLCIQHGQEPRVNLHTSQWTRHPTHSV